MSKRLGLYNVDLKYIRDLAAKDSNVLSVSPQTGKEARPFVGVVVICGTKDYCIPLSSPKPKHYHMNNDRDFSKITDKKGKLIGVLNFNEMIPIDKSLIKRIDIRVKPNDSLSDKHYKEMLNDQLTWCNDNASAIINKADKLYKIVTQTPDKYRNLVHRCCDFKKLENVLEKRLAREDRTHSIPLPQKKTGMTMSRNQTKAVARKIVAKPKEHDKSRDKSKGKNKPEI